MQLINAFAPTDSILSAKSIKVILGQLFKKDSGIALTVLGNKTDSRFSQLLKAALPKIKLFFVSVKSTSTKLLHFWKAPAPNWYKPVGKTDFVIFESKAFVPTNFKFLQL
jgi:hypothetical protein